MTTITVPAAIVSAIVLTAGVKDVRYYLNGVHFNSKGNRLESTDGHRVSVVNFERSTLDLTSLPENTIVQLRGKIPTKSENVAFDFNAKVATCLCKVGGVLALIPFELTGGVFPNVDMVIPNFVEDKERGYLVCSADYISDACKQTKLLRDGSKVYPLKIVSTTNGATYAIKYREFTLNGYIMGMRE